MNYFPIFNLAKNRCLFLQLICIKYISWNSISGCYNWFLFVTLAQLAKAFLLTVNIYINHSDYVHHSNSYKKEYVKILFIFLYFNTRL